MKAIINKETAERMLADEDLLRNVNSKLKGVSVSKQKEPVATSNSANQGDLENKIDSTFQSLEMKFKNSQIETKAEIQEIQD